MEHSADESGYGFLDDVLTFDWVMSVDGSVEYGPVTIGDDMSGNEVPELPPPSDDDCPSSIDSADSFEPCDECRGRRDPYFRLCDDCKEKIRSAYRSGRLTVKMITNVFGGSRSNAYKIINSMDPARGRRGRRLGRPPSFGQEEQAVIRNACARRKGLSLDRLAAMLYEDGIIARRITKATLSRILRGTGAHKEQ
ncbi:hypothetical protein GMRT_10103 [Giardia muris]|uniref:Uncharacterized protein n=1 Tax=Giardia muris TaxID=5742 RepID=A0A4Z1T1F7_GIAMU|nr:hypothetical protein GMRT_10103 [Giardia muris]|eukprot:TNJ27753.1 hypothetical protein GMRT_10103 [Giardia muris]